MKKMQPKEIKRLEDMKELQQRKLIFWVWAFSIILHGVSVA